MVEELDVLDRKDIVRVRGVLLSNLLEKVVILKLGVLFRSTLKVLYDQM